MKTALHQLKVIAGIVWASPCTAVGMAIGLAVVANGGSAQKVGRVIEFTAPGPRAASSWLAKKLPWSAITLGHVVIGVSSLELERLRAHEFAHVEQFERWGTFLLAAYPLASLAALLRGGCPYKANWFEQQAFEAERRHRNAA